MDNVVLALLVIMTALIFQYLWQFYKSYVMEDLVIDLDEDDYSNLNEPQNIFL